MEKIRYSATAFFAFGFAISPLWLGFSAKASPEPNFSVNTPVHLIAANPSGKAVLDRDIPALMASRSYSLCDDMSLAQIASVSGGRFTTAKLNRLEGDLAKISVR